MGNTGNTGNTAAQQAAALLQAAGIKQFNGFVLAGKHAGQPMAKAQGGKIVCNVQFLLANGNTVTVAQASATGSLNLHNCGLGKATINAPQGKTGWQVLNAATGNVAPLTTAFVQAAALLGYAPAVQAGQPYQTATGYRLVGHASLLFAGMQQAGLYTVPAGASTTTLVGLVPAGWLVQGKGGRASAGPV